MSFQGVLAPFEQPITDPRQAATLRRFLRTLDRIGGGLFAGGHPMLPIIIGSEVATWYSAAMVFLGLILHVCGPRYRRREWRRRNQTRLDRFIRRHVIDDCPDCKAGVCND